MRESNYQNAPWISLKQYNSGVNHGTFLHIAHEEGLIRNTSIHAGIRAPVMRPKGDVRNDLRCGFEMVKARAIDRLGVAGIIDKLKSRVSGTKVYISVDIDVLDPAFAPGKSSHKTYQGRSRTIISDVAALASTPETLCNIVIDTYK